jgi:hypothetical protein
VLTTAQQVTAGGLPLGHNDLTLVWAPCRVLPMMLLILHWVEVMVVVVTQLSRAV